MKKILLLLLLSISISQAAVKVVYIEPTDDKLKYDVKAYGLTADGSAVPFTFNLKTDKQGIIDLLATDEIKDIADPLRMVIYFNDDGTVSRIDIQTATGSKPLDNSPIKPDLSEETADIAVVFRELLEAKPSAPAAEDKPTLKEVSTKDEAL